MLDCLLELGVDDTQPLPYFFFCSGHHRLLSFRGALIFQADLLPVLGSIPIQLSANFRRSSSRPPSSPETSGAFHWLHRVTRCPSALGVLPTALSLKDPLEPAVADMTKLYTHNFRTPVKYLHQN